MDKRLSRRLGPSAKNLYLGSPAELRCSTLVTLAPSIDRQTFQDDLARHHGSVRSWMPEANIASVDIEIGALMDLAALDGVVYVEAGQAYKP